MTTIFERAPKFDGISGDYVRVAVIGNRVGIRAIDALSEEAATISMTPEQARALAQGIIEAADRAEGKQ